ncbi:NADPH-dependent FMN reductase [Uniformispora flossi]|uniref:NADPH-dependent FMN reductase n=1 Tax=Uniformispora flossi TaxID=3390723 RepID=UPI003C30397B
MTAITSTTPTTAAAAAGPLRMVVVVGSNRDGRIGGVVADWFVGQARAGGWEVDVVDLADTPLPAAILPPGTSDAPEVVGLGERLAAADAFAVVTPEYNHSFPAVLKHAIDLFREEWRAKPVAFVSYGGMGGGLRAVEQLRLVFAELHAVSMRDSVSFHGVWSLFDEDGVPVDQAGTNAAAKGMLGQLDWWGRTLREGRAVRPYDV